MKNCGKIFGLRNSDALKQTIKNCGRFFGFLKFGHFKYRRWKIVARFLGFRISDTLTKKEAKTEHVIIIIEILMALYIIYVCYFVHLQNLNVHLKCSNSFLWANCCCSSFSTVTIQFLPVCKTARAPTAEANR